MADRVHYVGNGISRKARVERAMSAIIILSMVVGILVPVGSSSFSNTTEDSSNNDLISNEDLDLLYQKGQSDGIRFEENVGQFPDHVRYNIVGRGMESFLLDSGIMWVLTEPGWNEGPEVEGPAIGDFWEDAIHNPLEIQAMPPKKWAVQLEFVDSAQSPKMSGKETLQGTTNYMMGPDPDSWFPHVPHYSRVVVHDVWPGIDIEWFSHEGGIKYDIHVSPGADPRRIKFDIQGSDTLYVDNEDRLMIDTPLGPIVKGEPITYQFTAEGRREIVDNQYSLDQRSTIGFDIGAYDRTRPLIIDPLVYSTYLGGGSADRGMAISSDDDGNTYITGATRSDDFPVTPGAVQSEYLGEECAGGLPCWMAFVTKFSRLDGSLLFSTYLGGTGDDMPRGLAVDRDGYAYLDFRG